MVRGCRIKRGSIVAVAAGELVGPVVFEASFDLAINRIIAATTSTTSSTARTRNETGRRELRELEGFSRTLTLFIHTRHTFHCDYQPCRLLLPTLLAEPDAYMSVRR